MRVSLKSLFAGVAISALALSASAAPLSISSTVDESGSTIPQTGGTYPLTTATGYDFTGMGANTLTSIDSLTVTLTVVDGNSGAGDFDFNSLFLSLDGINTGLALNGFLGGQIVTLDLSGNPALAGSILTALQADNHLVGGVFDIDADGPAGNVIGFPGTIQTTLVINGQSNANGGGGGTVPLPAAIFIAPLGAGLAGIYSRRFRRTK
jgi:hypothetical protein